MPAIADQVATIEHDLAVAQTTVDSLRSENAQLKTALAALNVDHTALQAKHSDALALVDETRMHADGVATAALAMLKISRRQIVAAPSEGTKALLNMPITTALNEETTAKITEIVTAALEPEKTDVRPELPEAEQGDNGDETSPRTADVARLAAMAGTTEDGGIIPSTEGGINREPNPAWRNAAPGEMVEVPNTDRLRAHMPGEDPLPIFLKPRAVPEANVLG